MGVREGKDARHCLGGVGERGREYSIKLSIDIVGARAEREEGESARESNEGRCYNTYYKNPSESRYG